MNKESSGGNSFLSQFDSKSYAGAKKPAGTSSSEPKTIPRAAPARPGASSSNSKIKAPDHMVVTDQSYHKRKIVKWSIMGGSAIVLAILAFFGFRMFNAVEIMDFTGRNWSEMAQWQITNGVTVQRNDEFNLEFDEGIIFGQSVEPGSSVQRGSVIVLDVSQGADPNEVIDLPDFENMTTGEINTWRREMRMGNSVQVREENHDTIEAGRFISLEHPPAVDLASFTRSNSLTITMSSGPRVLTMPNFVGRDVAEVETWEEQNNVNFTYEVTTDFPEDTEPGEVLAQSIEPRERFNHNEEVIITVAAGEVVIVPDFSQLSVDEVEDLEGLTVIRRERFSTTVPFGRVISQSVAAGTELMEANPRVTVTYSVGRPFMEDLRGQSENVLASHFFENFERFGANITFAVRYVDSYEARGEIVAASHFAQFIGLNDHIVFDVSRGNLTPPEPEPEPVPTIPTPEPVAPPAPEPTPEPEPTPPPAEEAGGDDNYHEDGYHEEG